MTIHVKLTLEEVSDPELNACSPGIEWFNSIAPDGVIESDWTTATQIEWLLKAPAWVSWAMHNSLLPMLPMSGADLQGANLQGADLRGADLQEADLRRANLQEAYLSETDLRGADLRGADLRGANLNETDLREANLLWTRRSEDPPSGWKIVKDYLESE